MELVIVSGRSGSGKSIALQALEDQGFYAIDNLPAMLLSALIDELEAGSPHRNRVAVSIDARNLPSELERFPEHLEALSTRGIHCRVVYLTADSRVLLERYAGTRRRHPLTRETQMTLAEAIEAEHVFLSPIRNTADLVIDTSSQSVHDLRRRIAEQVARHAVNELTLTFESFGFKRGVPLDADMVFDVRCLPNPYWDPRYRTQTGQDSDVIAFLEAHDEVKAMFDDICQWLERWMPSYLASHRSYLTVAIGCTGGQHRSVYLTEQLGEHFAGQFPAVRIRHRELTIQRAVSEAGDASA
ncbi:RNase adapter RapZ [Kushneria phyllosphaerae]|nr:RNase adapter RapZ [Kushneria phyllosphaerae]